MKMNLFAYTCKLLPRWKNTLSMIIFLSNLIPILFLGGVYPRIFAFLDENIVLSRNVLGAIILWYVILWLSGYVVYQDVIGEYPTEADLAIDVRNVSARTTAWNNGIPLSPIQIKIDLNIRNKGKEDAAIEKYEIIDLDMKSELLRNEPISQKLFWWSGNSIKNIVGQYPIAGNEWIKNLTYEFRVEFDADIPPDPDKFAKNLKETFNDFSFKIKISYTTMSEAKKPIVEFVPVDISSFILQMIEKWIKDDKRLFNLFTQGHDL